MIAMHNFGNENIFRGAFLHLIEKFMQEEKSGRQADFLFVSFS
jgi:hypothetical protein